MKQESLYFNNIQLKTELDRCLGCKTKPCMNACPVKCDPQYFISKAKEKNFKKAALSIHEKNPLGHICGLVCPSNFCMKACTRAKIDHPINIPKIQATILQKENAPINIPNNVFQKERIAIIGSGPAGIGAFITFLKNGFSCTLFEKEDKLGGTIHLIPEFRLPRTVINQELKNIDSNNFDIQKNCFIQDPISLLEKGYNYVVIASGLETDNLLNIKGEEYCLSYQEYLSHPNKYLNLKKVAIIGGGNVAADCALSARQNNTEYIDVFVRRRICDMRISSDEMLSLIQNKININPLLSPTLIQKVHDKYSISFTKNEYQDEKLSQTDNILSFHDFDLVIRATGSSATKHINHPNIFYTGDTKLGPSSVVEALADGKAIALQIIHSLLK